MRTIMLDELDARVLFLPQLEMAIDGGRDDEVRAVFMLRSMGKRKRGERVGNCKPILEQGREQTHRVTATKFITSRCMKLL